MTDFEFYWVAGLLEGEGSFLSGPPSNPHSPIIEIQMTDRDVLVKLGKIVGYKVSKRINRKNPNYKSCWSIAMRGRKAYDLMERLRPVMGNRRKRQIDSAMACYKHGSRAKLMISQVREIKRRLIDSCATHAEIAKEYGVSRKHITSISLGKTWEWVEL